MQLPQVMRVNSVHAYDLTGKLVSSFPVSAHIDRSVAPFAQPFVLYYIVKIHTSVQHTHTHTRSHSGLLGISHGLGDTSVDEIIFKFYKARSQCPL
jgi:hypothetical protein